MLEEHISIVGIQFSSYSSAGVYKKQSFGRGGGGKLIHILTFWGRLIQFFPLTRVKVDIFQTYS